MNIKCPVCGFEITLFETGPVNVTMTPVADKYLAPNDCTAARLS